MKPSTVKSTMSLCKRMKSMKVLLVRLEVEEEVVKSDNIVVVLLLLFEVGGIF